MNRRVKGNLLTAALTSIFIVEFHVPNGANHGPAYNFFGFFRQIRRMAMLLQNLADDGRHIVIVFKEFF